MQFRQCRGASNPAAVASCNGRMGRTSPINALNQWDLGGNCPAFCSGRVQFRHDRDKAAALEVVLPRPGQAFLRFVIRISGRSAGDFREGRSVDGKDDALGGSRSLTSGEQILVGSAWADGSCCSLRAQPDRGHKAMIRIAAAPDFTENLIWATFSPPTIASD